MQYLCSQCRVPLQRGLTMCRCGQIFDSPVPEFNPDSASYYWPQASASRPAVAVWWDSISPAVKASVAGVVALCLAVPTVGSVVHRYQTLRGPGTPVVVASAAPAPVQAAPVDTTPAAPAPIVMVRAPEPKPADRLKASQTLPAAYNQTRPNKIGPPDPPSPRDDVPSPPSPLQTASTAAAEAEQNGVTAVWRGGENEPKTTDYDATISNSPALSTMLRAMDQMAQTQGVTNDLVNLRGRFQNFLAKAYGVSVDDLMADGDNYMRLQNSHPGLSG